MGFYVEKLIDLIAKMRVSTFIISVFYFCDMRQGFQVSEIE